MESGQDIGGAAVDTVQLQNGEQRKNQRAGQRTCQGGIGEKGTVQRTGEGL